MPVVAQLRAVTVAELVARHPDEVLRGDPRLGPDEFVAARANQRVLADQLRNVIDAAVMDPDLQDVTLADARALGGPRFVDLVTLDATAVADDVCPWDGRGDEPPERHSVWAAAAWTLVDARRAELVGETVITPSGGARVVEPARCPHGHPLRPGRVLAGWRPCRCGGHKSWECTEPLRTAPSAAASCSGGAGRGVQAGRHRVTRQGPGRPARYSLDRGVGCGE